MEMQRSLPQPWNSLWWAHQGSYFIHKCTAASSLWAVPLGKVSVWVCVCIWVRGIPRFCRNPKETQVIRKRRVRVQEAARFLTRREKNNPWKPLGWISKHGSRKKSPDSHRVLPEVYGQGFGLTFVIKGLSFIMINSCFILIHQQKYYKLGLAPQICENILFCFGVFF